MNNTLAKLESSYQDVDPVLADDLRKALLQIDRIETRKKGQRRLERIAKLAHPALSPVAQSGLAASFFWSGDVYGALYWCRLTVGGYPMSPSALLCSSLLVSIYRTLGMRKERFEAEGDRLRIMKKIALQSASIQDRIFALNELKTEMEMRDRQIEAQKCHEELQALIKERATLDSLPC